MPRHLDSAAATRTTSRSVVATACAVLAVVGLLAAANGSRATAAATHRNRLANASFEHSLTPWDGTRLERTRLRAAPAGRYVVRAATSRGRLAIDDWPGEVTSTAGATYRGRMVLRAASQCTVGKRISLVVREHTQAGRWVASRERTVRLTGRFERVVILLRAVRSGDLIDVYAYVHHPRRHNAFFADRAWLSVPPVGVRSRGIPLPPAGPSAGPGSSSSPIWASAPPTAPVSTNPPTSSDPTGSGVASSTLGELSIDTGQADDLGDTSQYGYVVLQDYMHAHVADIKRANPDTKVLAYLETVTQTRACSDPAPPAYSPHDSFGVNYCYAAAHHPEWFLTDAAGRPITYADYSRYAVMDVGNPGYQDLWAANAIAAARADGFDGIYIDDVDTYPGHGIDGQISEYTDQEYGSAMTSFIASVADQLRAGGLLAVANVATDPWVGWQRADALAMAAHLTALAREHYVRYGDICGPFSERFNTTATNGTPPIDELLAYDQDVQAAGAGLLGTDYGYSTATGADVATMTYGRAAFLLAWDGRPGSAYIFRPCGTVDPADPAWMIDVGVPTGAVQLVDGVYQRAYSAGLVLLNPSRSTPVDVSISAGYVTLAGDAATTITVPAQGAVILREG